MTTTTATDERTCSCGMPRRPVEGEPRLFSREWHVKHRQRHLDAYPDLDDTSRSVLIWLIEEAT